MSRLQVALTLAAHVPPAVWRPLVAGGAVLASLRPPRALRQWQLNAEVLCGRRPGRLDTARAAASWARNLMESAQLGSWSRERVLDAVVISAQDRQRLVQAHQQGGAVVGLPHMGSWDLAGAWACLSGLPVTSVAEQVPEFDWFVAARARLGMRIHGHRDPRVMERLLADRREGRIVCLVTDRAFGRHGIPVTWATGSGPRQVRMPGGAARLALETGATLLGIACHYQGSRMRMVVSEPIAGDDLPTLCQGLADFFSAQAASNPTDWHVLVPFFPGAVAA